ncbi:MAG TPA: hypothetical protein QF455_02780, partial [Phycisphaerales bacterium]|nr:hypothetical protein [Phycisphaerales bacterium]
CVGTSCSVMTSTVCGDHEGTYQGDESTCDGDPCGEVGCPEGEIADCNGNCCPITWIGDGFCDDGAYEWNGVPIYLNCPEFKCDWGDCDEGDCHRF